jgi:hypothetical protein
LISGENKTVAADKQSTSQDLLANLAKASRRGRNLEKVPVKMSLKASPAPTWKAFTNLFSRAQDVEEGGKEGATLTHFGVMCRTRVAP